MSETQCKTCSKDCSAKTRRSNENEKDFLERQAILRRMCRIKHKLLVLSGKGGVGKSTVAVNLAVALAKQGKKVGLIDADIHGPSIPKLLGLENAAPEHAQGETVLPVDFNDNLKVMSIAFFLMNADDALIWRGPMKMGLIKQFLKDVEWGELDYLLFDLPPGTGDEPLSICQLIEKPDGAVIVTTPQDVAIADVRKSVNFCRKLELPVLGVIENMSGFVCPHCGKQVDIFSKDGTVKMTDEMKIPFAGKIPFNPKVVLLADAGKPFISDDNAPDVTDAFKNILSKLKL